MGYQFAVFFVAPELLRPDTVPAGAVMRKVAAPILGVRLRERHGETVVEHGGWDPGFRCAVAALPARRAGALVLTNFHWSWPGMTECILDAIQGIAPRLTEAEPWTFEYESARRTLLGQLKAQTLQGFGLDDRPAAVSAAGALVQHLRDTQKADLAHVRDVSYRRGVDCLVVDPTTLKNLEVIEAQDGGRTGSLLHEIDRSITPMGGRLLRAWLLRPLVALERIQDRLDANHALADSLGINGTPSFVVGKTLIPGAVDIGRLAQLVQDQRTASN